MYLSTLIETQIIAKRADIYMRIISKTPSRKLFMTGGPDQRGIFATQYHFLYHAEYGEEYTCLMN